MKEKLECDLVSVQLLEALGKDVAIASAIASGRDDAGNEGDCFKGDDENVFLEAHRDDVVVANDVLHEAHKEEWHN